jgi:hypothetical protein
LLGSASGGLGELRRAAAEFHGAHCRAPQAGPADILGGRDARGASGRQEPAGVAAELL